MLYDELDHWKATKYTRPRDHVDVDVSSKPVSLQNLGVVETPIAGVDILAISTVSTTMVGTNVELIISKGDVHDNLGYPPLLMLIARGYADRVKSILGDHPPCDEGSDCPLAESSILEFGVSLGCTQFRQFFDPSSGYTVARILRNGTGVTRINPALEQMEIDIIVARKVIMLIRGLFFIISHL